MLLFLLTVPIEARVSRKIVVENRPMIVKNKPGSETIAVEGVVAQNGEFIDAKVVEGTDPDFSQSALDAVAHYKFKPATLDGKPVAAFVRMEVAFRR
jgi:TonB family protein